MRFLKKIISVLLIAIMINGMLPGLWQTAFAATSIGVHAVSYSGGSLVLKWDAVPAAASGTITYHTPAPDGSVVNNSVLLISTDFTSNTKTITGLAIDYICDITVNIKDTNSIPIASGNMYYLPQISFNSEIVDQQTVINPGGGSETGVMPALKLSWNMPKVFKGGNFVFVNSAFDTIYPQDINLIKKLNFTINISDNVQKSDIEIKYDIPTSSYSAIISNDLAANACSVKFNNITGKLYFYILGVKEEGVAAPSKAEVLADEYASTNPPVNVLPTTISSVPGERDYVLPDSEILPGTIYYLKLNALFTDAGNNYVSAISYGIASNPLLGPLSYTYTPIRFELTKDSMDNINVKIYKINKGNQSIPQLYYEVQLNSLPEKDDATWNQGPFKNKGKKLDGLNFSGAFAYTVITGIGVNNKVYYRIVVKSNFSTDRLESMIMEYKLQADTSKPPIPKNVIIEKRELVTNPSNPDKSTDVTISWDKPTNWDQIIKNEDVNNDVVFHFLLNTYQSDLNISPPPSLEANGHKYGNFPVKYRMVKYVSARSTNIKVIGNRLSYTIKGYELFQGEFVSAFTGTTPKTPTISPIDLDSLRDTDTINVPPPTTPPTPPTKYPNYLLPNTVYYMQIYTTDGQHKDSTNTADMSDKSLTVSFTTLTGVEREVPLPDKFILNKNNIDSAKINFLELQFNKVKIDWNNYTSNHDINDAIYYDLYMSTRPDTSSFVKIGTTQPPNGDISFDKVTDLQSLFITAKISKFANGSNNNTLFGLNLLPNTTYYFYIKTRLSFVNDPTHPKESIPTAILPVTTIRTDIKPDDESARRPVAPIDFAIAKDANGDLMLKGQAVTFSWTNQEDDVEYQLICTSQRIASDISDQEFAELTNDPTYTSFIAKFGASDFDGDNTRLSLNPFHTPGLQGNLEYNATTKQVKFTIDTWLFPNKLYYFTLRTIKTKTTPTKYSVWVSIPVTTSLIEGPTSLEPVNDSEIGFNWRDSVIDLTRKSEDYRVSIKGPKDTVYKVLTRAQAMVVLDGPKGGFTNFYGRVFNLSSNTPYYIKVERAVTNAGVTTYTTVYPVGSATGLFTTKDDFHQLEVKWKGLPVDTSLSKFEVAIKAPDEADYTILDPAIDLENYTDITGTSSFPYYIDKTLLTTGTSYSIYHAKIKSMLKTYPDGTSLHEPLKANTKYSIKVRAKKIDASNAFLISYSKFIGPVDTRTEFNQSDYDQTDEDLKKKASYLDKITKLEENVYWRMNLNNSKTNKIMLKGDRLLNTIENNVGYSSTLDFSALGESISSDIIYMPVSIARVLNSEDKTLIVKTSGSEFTFRPTTLSVDDIQEIKNVQNKTGVTDLYLKLLITRIDTVPSNEITGNKNISKVDDFKVQVLGTSKTDGQLREMYHDKLYDDKTGIIKSKTDILSGSNANLAAMTPQKTTEYIDGLVHETESDLGDYINTTFEGTNGTTGVIVSSENIKTFSNPMLVKLSFNNEQGLKSPYVYYEGAASWQKLTTGISIVGNSMTFNAGRTGKYGVFLGASAANDLPSGYIGKDSINKFTSKYDLNDVFVGINKSFNPELNVSGKEIIMLYEKIMNKANQDSSMEIKQRLKNLQLDSIVNQNNINRNVQKQELAAILLKIYSNKMAVNAEVLKPVNNIFVNDEKNISNKFYNSCIISLNLKLLALDQNNNFLPEDELTRAETITAFEKVLELTGDIK